MDAGTLAVVLSALSIPVAGTLAVVFLRDPERGMVMATHRAEFLPQVMADRYLAFFLMAMAATLYRDMAVIAFLFAMFAVMAFGDALIYARAGHRYALHLASGLGATVVALTALLALSGSGVAS